MGAIEMLAGEAEATEREVREAVEFFRRSGDVYFLTSQEAELARALWTQGRFKEAEEVNRSSQAHAGTEDLTAQAQWRQTRALLLASGGMRLEAEQVARAAIELLADTDFTWMKALGSETLGTVLELCGDPKGAVGAFREALDRWEKKGNVVSAERLRQKIRELSTI